MPSGVFTLKQVNQALTKGAWSNQKPINVEYLVVAGGGGGGGNNGGGGGAGGLLSGIVPVAANTSYTVTVGAGGGNTANGSNSVFGVIDSSGGGAGSAGVSGSGSAGGSGGGAALSGSPGQGTFGQGNSGGNSDGISTNAIQGGGGGAGTRGFNGNYAALKSGDGGSGIASAISGATVVYAGGGGSSSSATSTGGLGGVGGGGAGFNGSGFPVAGGAGTANTGGGGGGGSRGSGAGGAGGSGIVILSYPDIYQAAASTTGSPTVSTSGSGSLAFVSASSQVVVFSANSAFQFGTGDLTWESWVYMSASGSYGFYDLSAINASGGFGIFTSGSTIYVRIDGGNDLTYAAPGSFFGNWVHLAVVRSGSTMTLYYNGSSVATGTRTQNLTQQTPYIGNLNGLNYYLNGNMSNMRVVKGTAVYTGNFTPSTTPLTAVSGTSLLLNSVSGAYLANNATNGLAPTTGTTAPTWSSSSPFTVTGYKNRVYTWTSSGSITF
jgi:hypothetical protein